MRSGIPSQGWHSKSWLGEGGEGADLRMCVHYLVGRKTSVTRMRSVVSTTLISAWSGRPSQVRLKTLVQVQRYIGTAARFL